MLKKLSLLFIALAFTVQAFSNNAATLLKAQDKGKIEFTQAKDAGLISIPVLSIASEELDEDESLDEPLSLVILFALPSMQNSAIADQGLSFCRILPELRIQPSCRDFTCIYLI